MRVDKRITCTDFPCVDANHQCFVIPCIDVKPDRVTILLISEAAPAAPGDYYYAGKNALFAQTTVQAFQDAGAPVAGMRDITGLGVYLTTAVKCGKTGYGIRTDTVKRCSLLLEQELALFSNAKALLLMGDVAIQALNAIARRSGEPRVVPATPTYKLRGQEFSFRGARVYPSYLQAGPSFFIERSKRKMIAEDIAAALRIAGVT